MIEQEYKGTFLNQFEENARHYVTNLFVWANRGGNWAMMPKAEYVAKMSELLGRVKDDVECKLRNSHFNRDLHSQLLSILQDEETKNFARFIALRQKEIAARAPIVEKAVAAKPPSDKQLAFLKRLGHKGKKPETMDQASMLINKLKTGEVVF